MNIEKLFDKISMTPNENEIKVLKKFFPQCFDKEGRFLIEIFRSLIEHDTDISKESYSLEWLGKSYARVLANEPVRTFVKENIEWNTKEENKDSQNLLIKGDNLEVLKHMVNAYSESIKMIYIDPPYNTGNDGFVYQDDRKFTPEELSKLAGIDIEKAKRILEFVNSKSNSHSAWLTFMYPRLYIARQLLKEDGVIFISIDDNEVAQLRLMMNEIFWEENFIRNVIWEKKYSPANDSKVISDTHDHILVYARNINKWKLKLLPRSENANKRYSNPDNDPRGLWKPGGLSAKTYNEKYDYPITTPSGKVVYPPTGSCWQISQERLEELKKDNRIYFGKNNDSKPQIKQFLCEVQQGIVPKSIWKYNEVGHNQTSRNELTKLFNGVFVFDNPKPVKLIKQMLNIAYFKKNDIVLDFFAGSGTAGDAIMQLNAEDVGDRKYILIQLPEPIDPKKNKTAYEFVKNELGIETPTIFDITKERLVRATKKIIDNKEKEIEEIQEAISKIENKEKKTKKDEQKLTELQEKLNEIQKEIERIKLMDLGFKIFETVDIPKELLENAEELSDNLPLPKEIDTDTLLTTWKLYDGAKLTQEPTKINFEGYTAYLVDNRLYLLNSGFTTDNLVVMLRKIDEDNSFAPSKVVANGYALSSKAQRELYEGILNFVNKKRIELEFIVRY